MKKAYTLIELLVVISIIGFMAIYCVPAFAKFGRSSDFKQKSDEVKILMQRTYALSRSPENTRVQYYRMRVDSQAFVLERTEKVSPVLSADWTEVSRVEKLLNSPAGSGTANNLQTIQCDNAPGNTACVILTCSVNPQKKCDISTIPTAPITTMSQISLRDYKISGMKNLANFTFEGVNKDGAYDSGFKSNSPFNVVLTYTQI